MGKKPLEIQKAYAFYLKHLLNKEKQALLTEYCFPLNGTVPYVDWELFAAILTGEKRKDGYGADLSNFEVKSAILGSGFEYQYHKNAGLEKLEDELQVDHIFISYSESYNDIEVRTVKATDLKDVFESWRPQLKKNYKSGSGRQRFRKSVTFGFVLENGYIIFEVKNTKLVDKK